MGDLYNFCPLSETGVWRCSARLDADPVRRTAVLGA